jgi:hypothetical protein
LLELRPPVTLKSKDDDPGSSFRLCWPSSIRRRAGNLYRPGWTRTKAEAAKLNQECIAFHETIGEALSDWLARRS